MGQGLDRDFSLFEMDEDYASFVSTICDGLCFLRQLSSRSFEEFHFTMAILTATKCSQPDDTFFVNYRSSFRGRVIQVKLSSASQSQASYTPDIEDVGRRSGYLFYFYSSCQRSPDSIHPSPCTVPRAMVKTAWKNTDGRPSGYASYAALGILPDVKDEIVTYAYQLQCFLYPYDQYRFFHHLREICILRGEDSASLQLFVTQQQDRGAVG